MKLRLLRLLTMSSLAAIKLPWMKLLWLIRCYQWIEVLQRVVKLWILLLKLDELLFQKVVLCLFECQIAPRKATYFSL